MWCVILILCKMICTISLVTTCLLIVSSKMQYLYYLICFKNQFNLTHNIMTSFLYFIMSLVYCDTFDTKYICYLKIYSVLICYWSNTYLSFEYKIFLKTKQNHFKFRINIFLQNWHSLNFGRIPKMANSFFYLASLEIPTF